MSTVTQTAPASNTALWAGRIISALAVLFLVFDGVTKALRIPAVIEANAQLGYPAGQVAGIGILLLVCTAVYVIPQTAFLGAVLLTGYLGGAVATHVRVGSGLFPIVFTLVFGVLVWLGLYLRDQRLRKFLLHDE